jgi:hypothetical protein
VVDSATTIITIDFDIEKSVVFTGAGKDDEPKIIVKPVVKLTVEQPTPEPEVTSVNPSSGNQGQTLDVIITGTNFTGATVVSFGENITVNSFTVNNNTQITANITIAADAVLGTRDVSVTTPGGTGTKDDGFRITAPAV